ncbi:hypothetical protein [Campylobacter phage CJLB-7]|nr:hypothetical protein [Campylobacter phage CJLB-7]
MLIYRTIIQINIIIKIFKFTIIVKILKGVRNVT